LKDINMNNFDRKMEEAGARVNQKVADVADRMEREAAELITYLNNEVVPAIRTHSTKALRVAAEKLGKMADYLDEQKRAHS
jgi:hypothetical protein